MQISNTHGMVEFLVFQRGKSLSMYFLLLEYRCLEGLQSPSHSGQSHANRKNFIIYFCNINACLVLIMLDRYDEVIYIKSLFLESLLIS